MVISIVSEKALQVPIPFKNNTPDKQKNRRELLHSDKWLLSGTYINVILNGKRPKLFL